jgi:hypothetical protein
MTWALGDNQARAFVGNIKAEKIAQGDQVIWTRVAAKNPSGVAVSNTETTLSWTDDAGIELGFIIDRALDSAFTVDLNTSSVAANEQIFSDNGLTHNTTYYYRVKGDYPSGQVSDFSSTVTITTLNLVAPPTPASATGTSNSSISLSWVDNSNNEDGFKVERSTSPTGPFVEIADLPNDTTTYSDVGLVYNTTYHYRIIGYNTDNTSAPASLSATTTNDLLSPSGLTASPTSNSTIDLNWQDNTANEDGFKIARSTDGTNFTDIGTVNQNVTTYTDTGLSFNTIYHYEVRGYNTSGDSNTVSATATTTNSLVAPTNLITTSATNTSIGLQWTENSNNEDGFTLNGFDASNSMQPLGAVNLPANTSQYTWGSLLPDRTYSFSIVATNSSGSSSALSGSFTTTDTLSDVTGLTSTATSNSTVSLSWNDTSDNEDGFTLERATGSGAFSALADLAANTTSFSDSNLTANNTYTYQIRGYNSNGTSNFVSTTVTTEDTLSDITGLTSTATSNSTVSLSWSDTSGNEDGFTVQKATGNGAFAHLADLAANTTSFSDSNLTANNNYTYKVRSYNSNGTSNFVSTTVTTQDTLVAPSIQTVTAPEHDQVLVNWSDGNNNEDSFQLEFSTNTGGSYSAVPVKSVLNQPTGAAQYLHEGLNGSTNYQYRIRAVNSSGTSPWSNMIAVTTPAGMIAPSIVSGTQVGTDINLTIQDNTVIEEGFTVERSSVSNTAGFSAVSTLPANSTSYTNGYTNPLLTPSTVYYYRVKANNSTEGDSPYSNVISVQYEAQVANTTCTSTFIGQNELGFSFTSDSDSSNTATSYVYELSDDASFSNIVSTNAFPSLLENYAFNSLTSGTTYYARLVLTGIYDTSSGSAGSSGAIATDPCVSTSVQIADDGDSTQTVTVTGARPQSLITITESALSSGIRGSFSTLAEDQFQDPFLGLIRSSAEGGGKITVDGGMLKYVGYLPPSIVSTYGDGAWWSTHSGGLDIGGPPRWTTTDEAFLDGGGSIYDSANIDAQWAFLYNNINFLSRSENKTNKVLYINDYKNGISGTQDFPYYGAHKFYHGFKYISEYAGYTFDQLAVNTGAGNTWLHYNAIETLHSTAQQWTDYFNGYDLIIYVGVNGDSRGHIPSIAYLPQIFIDGYLNFIDGGGGSYITTDHEPIFTVAVNQILSNYGIFANGSVDRTPSNNIYKVSSILANQSYVPQGWHPLFSGLDLDSSILAANTEALIEYNTGQDTTNYPIISTTSNYTADSSGNLTITSHDDNATPLGAGALHVVTADGCGQSGVPPGATTTWADTGLSQPEQSALSNSTSLQAVTSNVGDTDEDSYTGGVIAVNAYSKTPGTTKTIATGPYEQLINGEWYHIAFSQDGRRSVMWVNGLPVGIHTDWHLGGGGTSASNAAAQQHDTYAYRYSYDSNRFGPSRWGIGAAQHSSWSIDNCFNGVIDQPVFFDSPIYQGDIDELYNGSNGLLSTSWTAGLINKVIYKAEFTGTMSGSNVPTGAQTTSYGYKNEINPSSYIVGNPNGFTLRVSGPNSGRSNSQKIFQPGSGKVSSSGYHPFQSDLNLHNPGANDYTKQQVWDELNGLTDYGSRNSMMHGSTTTTTKFRTQLAFPSAMAGLHEGGSWGFSAWFKREGEGPSKTTALWITNDSYYNVAQKGVGSNILTCYPYPFLALANGNPETTLYDHYRVSS